MPSTSNNTQTQSWLSLSTWKEYFFPKNSPEPSYPPLPLLDDTREAKGLKGLYVIGEVGGTPLIKLGLNEGHETIDRLVEELGKENATEGSEDVYDVIIIGAGASGVGATMRAKEKNLRYLTLESNKIAQTVVSMTKGKVLFAEPEDLEKKSSVWFEECTREEFLARWKDFVKEEQLEIRENTKVTDIQQKTGLFQVKTTEQSYQARRVVLAIGKAGNPRKAGVKGEKQYWEKISHRLIDPDEFENQNICIYGGGDVALEGALTLADNNHVTLVTIDKEFVFPKKRNIDALQKKAKEGKLNLFMNTSLKEVKETSVVIEGPEGKKEIENDHLFEMIGSELPLPFLKKVGLRIEGEWDRSRYWLLAGSFLFIYLFYAWKKAFPLNPSVGRYRPDLAAFPWNYIYPYLPKEWVVNFVRPLGFDTSFWYSLLYTALMLVFGVMAMKRWGGKHQRYRFISLIGFQVVFFFLVNLAAPPIVGEGQAWRAWGLYQPWPLFSNTFYWFSSSVKSWSWTSWFFVGFGVFLVLVFMPLMARYHGKRFCTWICGCGGLAETLGDRWRHMAPKGKQSRSWEFQGLVVFGWAIIALLVTFLVYDGKASNPIQSAYALFVDFWLVAVIPVALYPIYGGKVWCRYWCPLAAYNQVLSRWFGKLKIVSNDKCITCTLCSRYCQVGVDVMAFAKNQAAFDNRNSSCIHCGICIAVCPMDVLSFDSTPVESKKPVLQSKGAGKPVEIAA